MANPKPPPDAKNLPPGVSLQGALPWLREAQIVNFGTKDSFPIFRDSPENSLKDELGSLYQFEDEIHVLNLLQRTRTTGLDPSALGILLGALVDALPEAIQHKVGLHMGATPEAHHTGAIIGQPEWFSQDESDFKQTVEDLKNGKLLPLDSQNKEYILWVVNAGTPDIPYYVTIVLHYGLSDPSNPDVLDRVTDWGIADPLSIEETSATSTTTASRLQVLLEDQGIADAIEHVLWVPPFQDDEESASGLAAYSVIAQLLDRIGVQHYSKAEFDGEEFYAPTRPWFNPDAPFRDGNRENVPGGELAPSGNPPRGNTPPLTDRQRSQLDSLFEEARDAATQTEEPVVAETRRPAGVKAAQMPPARSCISPSSPSSTRSLPEPDDEDLVELYLARKRYQLDALKTASVTANEAIRDSAEFADRLVYEVLEAPSNNIPTAYAVERLFGLVRVALARHRNAEDRLNEVKARFTTAAIHNQVMNQLVVDLYLGLGADPQEGVRGAFQELQHTLRRGRTHR
ncbi:hypothetical protein NUW58_g4952 [Xylaria curta]|uniref:Uncharacterized protein n=1 Tax=Xylaria curta TaxID=42375 RepID=A0ACC1P5A2_9PEZI|nr:hypothetical protein NUW58_g4952 [Xylaria curta]